MKSKKNAFLPWSASLIPKRLERRGNSEFFVLWCEEKSEVNERLMSPHVTLWLNYVNQSFPHNKGRNPQNSGLLVLTSVD